MNPMPEQTNFIFIAIGKNGNLKRCISDSQDEEITNEKLSNLFPSLQTHIEKIYTDNIAYSESNINTFNNQSSGRNMGPEKKW